jgi:hypothetical protein
VLNPGKTTFGSGADADITINSVGVSDLHLSFTFDPSAQTVIAEPQPGLAIALI